MTESRSTMVQIIDILAGHIGESREFVARAFIADATPGEDGRMTIALENVERRLGLGEGFFEVVLGDQTETKKDAPESAINV